MLYEVITDDLSLAGCPLTSTLLFLTIFYNDFQGLNVDFLRYLHFIYIYLHINTSIIAKLTKWSNFDCTCDSISTKIDYQFWPKFKMGWLCGNVCFGINGGNGALLISCCRKGN